MKLKAPPTEPNLECGGRAERRQRFRRVQDDSSHRLQTKAASRCACRRTPNWVRLAGFAFLAVLFAVSPVLASLPMLTYHNDNTRAGANTNETTLTPVNVNTATFGKLFSYAVDGYVYGQPLVMTNVAIPGQGVHNVVYLVTEHDTAYAFDADSFVPAPYWTNSFINTPASVVPVPAGDAQQPNVIPEMGITATPVIDPGTGTIYIEARTREIVGGVLTYPHRLHALDITTGAERTNSPVLIDSTNYPGAGAGFIGETDGAGHILWNPLDENCRPALLLANGQVYLCYASPGDIQPYHGWVFAYDAHTLAQTGVFNTTPNGRAGGIWQSGNGPAADADGNVYFTTGNGTFDTNADYADSYLKLSATNGLALADYFTPYNQGYLASEDLDVSSAGLLLLPDSAGSAAHPHLLLGGSKADTIFLLDRDNLGQFNANGDTQIVQEVSGAVGGLWSSPAWFNGMFYIAGAGDSLKSFTLTNAVMSAAATARGPTTFGYPGATPAVSANGTNDAVVWAIDSSAFRSSGPEILHAYSATNVAQELYNSSQNFTRDNPGAAVLFTVPTVVNGRVYVGAEFALSVYGNGAFLAAPVISPGGGAFTNSVMVTISDASAGTAIYYTLDGSRPTTNSLPYTGAITLTNSAGVHALAVAAGAVNSTVTIAGFLNSAAAGTGTGLRGEYYSDQFKTLIPPPTLVRTDATINVDWSAAPPDPSITPTHFTVRWTGTVQPQYSEPYTFYAATDDGVRLWVNGQLLVDEWADQSTLPWSGTVNLVAQHRYDIEMDYFQDIGGAAAYLYWASPSTPEAILPTSQLYPFTNSPPVFTGTNSYANGVFQFQLSGTAGSIYVLQGSTNLANWISLSTNLAPADVFNLTDPGAGGFPRRFYRVIQQP